jgi:hypothetical protein
MCFRVSGSKISRGPKLFKTKLCLCPDFEDPFYLVTVKKAGEMRSEGRVAGEQRGQGCISWGVLVVQYKWAKGVPQSANKGIFLDYAGKMAPSALSKVAKNCVIGNTSMVYLHHSCTVEVKNVNLA